MSLLGFENVGVSYNGVPAVRGLSLHVEPGETVCLVGSNGAGKSTVLKALMGLVPADEGVIRFAGEDVAGRKTEARVAGGIGIAPEGRRVFPGLTVLENLKVGVNARSRDGMHDLLDLVYELFPKLRERRGQMGWSLSGGEQQMLTIGRALMGRPRLLLLDEPSLGLAPLVSRDVFRSIKTIGGRGTAVLVVEQNARIALDASHRGYVLENGRLVLEGSSSDLLADPRVKAAFLGEDQ